MSIVDKLVKNALIGASCLLCLQADAAPIYGPISYNNHQYILLSSSTWADAEMESVSLGGHLVTIDDVNENNFISNAFVDLVRSGSTFTAAGNLWIGLHLVGSEYAWVSGDPVTYTNWGPGEPNNTPGVVEMSMMSGVGDPSTGQWNDRPDYTWDFPHYGVAEIPEPSSILLFAIGFLLLLCSKIPGRRKGKG